MQEPRALPLERRTIQTQCEGITKAVPAIHKIWVTERAFPRYVAPPLPESGTLPFGAKETWLELTQLLQDDLRWLLALPYHIFWSQVILTREPIAAITSFLQEAPPAYCQTPLTDSQLEETLAETSKLVFLICRRLSTARESAENFMSMRALGDILYDNYIFTIPSLLDICAVYGVSNREGVQTMLDNITIMQPKYLGDLAMTEPHLVQLLDNAKTMLVGDSKKKKVKEIEDVVAHVYDSLATVRILFQVFAQAVEIVATPPFFSALATFYTTVMPELGVVCEVKGVVNSLRVECLRVGRTVLESVMDLVASTREAQHVERYLALVSEMMSESLFVMDYHSLHAVDADLDLLSGLCPDMDALKIDYLLEALSSHVTVLAERKDKPPEEPKNHVVNYPHNGNASLGATSSKQVSGVELESLITEVQDILPHLGAGFVEACLRYYNFSSEQVVAAVLESSLPPSIEELSFDLERSSLQDTNRLNVFDHDEFDVMTHDTIDTNRAFRGKKPSKHRNLNQLLSDKTEINEMRDRFASLGVVEDTTYDDEYDDTYESVDVAVQEADDYKTRRRFETPRVLRVYEPKFEEEEEEDEEVEAEQAARRDHFVQNPEELRARAEARRAEARRQRDVVGRAKGQGQTKEVQINREKKGVHKSSGANHHRRDRATKKRNQGMIPS